MPGNELRIGVAELRHELNGQNGEWVLSPVKVRMPEVWLNKYIG